MQSSPGGAGCFSKGGEWPDTATASPAAPVLQLGLCYGEHRRSSSTKSPGGTSAPSPPRPTQASPQPQPSAPLLQGWVPGPWGPLLFRPQGSGASCRCLLCHLSPSSAFRPGHLLAPCPASFCLGLPRPGAELPPPRGSQGQEAAEPPPQHRGRAARERPPSPHARAACPLQLPGT